MSSRPSRAHAPIGFRSTIKDFAERDGAPGAAGLESALGAEGNDRMAALNGAIRGEYDLGRRTALASGENGATFGVLRLRDAGNLRDASGYNAVLKLARPDRPTLVRTRDGKGVPIESFEAFLSLYVSRRMLSNPFFMRVHDAAFLGWNPLRESDLRPTGIILSEKLEGAGPAYAAADFGAAVAMAACVALALDEAGSLIGFRHRDLHLNNVMCRRRPHWVRGVVYRTRDGVVRYFAAPSQMQLFPVFIDYGYSTVSGLPPEMQKIGSWEREAMDPARVKGVNLGRDDFDRWIGTVAATHPTAAWRQVLGVAGAAAGYVGAPYNYGPLLDALSAYAPIPSGLETRDLLFVGYRAGAGGGRDDETAEAAALRNARRPPARRVSWRLLEWREDAVARALGAGYQGQIDAVFAGAAVAYGASIPTARAVHVAAAAQINRQVYAALGARANANANGAAARPPVLRAPDLITLAEMESSRFVALAPHFRGPVVRPRFCARVAIRPDPRYPAYEAWVLPPGARFRVAPDGQSIEELPPFELCPLWNPDGPEKPARPPACVPLS